MNNAIKPRPMLKLGYKDLGLPKGQVVHRIETFRTKRRWFEFWKPKYTIKLYALTNTAIYDITGAMND